MFKYSNSNRYHKLKSLFFLTAFGRLLGSKRQFYVLDDRHWRLFYYRCEEDFRSSKPPLGSIALCEAAINLTSPPPEDVRNLLSSESIFPSLSLMKIYFVHFQCRLAPF
ncbi:hypothetical protein CEXT_213051 [Caerostris extrusa]|uniref:Uncharacterized protein n=1 Tax=Caerostris extrusa TaxID=172846 RepID=A0AAV4QMG7_CAEEX|nr:hypothetical protein CEXT_213051 [Caerostris extrusa]